MKEIMKMDKWSLHFFSGKVANFDYTKIKVEKVLCYHFRNHLLAKSKDMQ